MARWRNFYPDNHIHFFTATILGRVPLFREHSICRAVLKVWDGYRSRMGFKILGYVLMLDHFHLMTHFESGTAYASFHRNSNRLIARRVIGRLRSHQRGTEWLSVFSQSVSGRATLRIWAGRPHSLAIRKRSIAEQKLQYIHMNPVRRGLADDPCDWIWSSARNYLRDDHRILRVDVDAFPLLD